MAVKAGKILTYGNGTLMSRLQNTGASNLNIPSEKVNETGDELTVATIYDIPDLSFDMTSWDVTIDPEAVLCGVDTTTIDDGDFLQLTSAVPLHVVSPIKQPGISKSSSFGVASGSLILESATYTFGVGNASAQAFTLRGDNCYYSPGQPYYEVFDGDGSTATFDFAHVAVKTVEQGQDIYALNVCVLYVDGSYKRLFHSADYTDTNGTVTLLDPTVAPSGSFIQVIYGSLDSLSFPQTIHPTVSVKPAEVKGKDVDIYVGIKPIYDAVVGTTSTSTALTGTGFSSTDVGARISGTGIFAGSTIASVTDATHAVLSHAATATGASVAAHIRPRLIQWKGVQSVEIDWKVTLDNDQELGNAHYVNSDYDVPDVSGNIVIRPDTIAYLFQLIAQITNTPTNQVANVISSQPLEMQIAVHHPDTGAVLKTWVVEDARIQPPPMSAQVTQKLQPTIPWNSDTGDLSIYKGAAA